MQNYSEKLKIVKSSLRELGLGAFFVLTKLNRQYLSGFMGSKGVLAVTPKSATLYVDDRYLIRARRESDLPVRKIEILSSRLRRDSRMTFGVEDRITLAEFDWLKRKLPKQKWKTTSNLTENLRTVKTPAEVASIRKGARIIDKIFLQLRQRYIKPGGTEGEIALEIARLAKKFGAQGLAFEPIVAWGANAAAPHHNPGKTRIAKNNFLLLDFGVVVRGYHSDFTRTLFVGRPKKWQERIYNIVLAAQERAVRTIRPGIQARFIDAAARDHIAKQGHGKYFTHNSGHGVGLEIHELPNLSPDSEDLLWAGMVVTVEPGIYIEKKAGVRIEDMVEITKDGGRVLSKVRKDFKGMIIM